MEIAPRYASNGTTAFVLGECYVIYVTHSKVMMIVGGFSEPHQSIPDLIEYHHNSPIEIIGKENIILIDPLPANMKSAFY